MINGNIIILPNSIGYLYQYPLFTVSVSQSTPIVVSVMMNSKSVNMELDTGAAVSLISQDTYRQYWPQLELEESNTQLKTYSGEFLETLGRVNVDVCYGDQQMTLPLVIVKGKGQVYSAEIG